MAPNMKRRRSPEDEEEWEPNDDDATQIEATMTRHRPARATRRYILGALQDKFPVDLDEILEEANDPAPPQPSHPPTREPVRPGYSLPPANIPVRRRPIGGLTRPTRKSLFPRATLQESTNALGFENEDFQQENEPASRQRLVFVRFLTPNGNERWPFTETMIRRVGTLRAKLDEALAQHVKDYSEPITICDPGESQNLQAMTHMAEYLHFNALPSITNTPGKAMNEKTRELLALYNVSQSLEVDGLPFAVAQQIEQLRFDNGAAFVKFAQQCCWQNHHLSNDGPLDRAIRAGLSRWLPEITSTRLQEAIIVEGPAKLRALLETVLANNDAARQAWEA